jgi:hypothetical protein
MAKSCTSPNLAKAQSTAEGRHRREAEAKLPSLPDNGAIGRILGVPPLSVQIDGLWKLTKLDLSRRLAVAYHGRPGHSTTSTAPRSGYGFNVYWG